MSRGILATLIGIAAAVTQTVNIVNTINTLVNAIHNLLFPPGPPIDFQNQATEIASIQAHVLDPTYGLQALQALMVANQTALLAAIGTPQQTGSPVTLPTTPPSGYGSTDAAAVAAAVWDTPGPTTGQPMIDLAENAGVMPTNWLAYSTQVNNQSIAGWDFVPSWNNSTPPNPGFDTPQLDYTTILDTDATPIDWLNRITGTIGNYTDGGGGRPVVSSSDGNIYWVSSLDQVRFNEIKADLFPKKINVPPIWPGLSNVTLGSTTALTNGLMLTGPMDGVIVAILSAPPGKAKYAYGSINAYQHIAALSFSDDDSHQEGFQPIQFESQIYAPKTMVTAAGVIFRVDPAVTGTVQPWTNN